MRVAIGRYPGTTCHLETKRAFDLLGIATETYFVWHEERDLNNPDLVILPGGYSYNDQVRPGALATRSPLSGLVKRFSEKGGPVIGIGNGFQILSAMGLLTGELLENPSTSFCKEKVHVRIENTENLIFKNQKAGEILKLPLACYHGRYWTDRRSLKEMEEQGRVVLRYVDEFGEYEKEDSHTGSFNSIAGIVNRDRNVLGMMVHPERAIEEIHSSTDGKKLLNIVL